MGAAALFDWLHSRKPLSEKPAAREPLRGFAAPELLLENLARRVPQYLDDVDQGRLIYPACRRTLSDAAGDVASVWDHTRLEAMRYVMAVPGDEFGLLSEAARQLELIDAYLFQRPHAATVIDFEGHATADFCIAIVAGLNWLTHCAQLAGVDPARQSGTIRRFRKLVTLAQGWWLAEGAAECCAQLLSAGQPPPLMLYLIWSEYTRLAKPIAAAAIFGASVNRSTKLVVLPAELIPRFEAACDPADLLGI
jgi:hypothetical protein